MCPGPLSFVVRRRQRRGMRVAQVGEIVMARVGVDPVAVRIIVPSPSVVAAVMACVGVRGLALMRRPS